MKISFSPPEFSSAGALDINANIIIASSQILNVKKKKNVFLDDRPPFIFLFFSQNARNCFQNYSSIKSQSFQQKRISHWYDNNILWSFDDVSRNSSFIVVYLVGIYIFISIDQAIPRNSPKLLNLLLPQICQSKCTFNFHMSRQASYIFD